MSVLHTAQPVDMKQFQLLLASVSPDVSVCVRGRHAVGKSEGVYQAAAAARHEIYNDPQVCVAIVAAFGGKIKTPQGYVSEWNYDLGVPVVERRLSQMTEGDIIGLPFKEGEDKFSETGARVSFSSTQFKPCDWLITSAEFPVVLFLDERNRALPGVKQAVFQLTDSKAFYNTNLHTGTKIVIAENVGDAYQVESCDPAEVSRCATVILEPSLADFLKYIKPRCNHLLHDYLAVNEKAIEHKGAFEPDKKYPDRRSWFKLDNELTQLGLYADPSSSLLPVIVGAFVGVEEKAAFVSYVREYSRQVSAKDIMASWTKAKKRLKGKSTISNESFMECAIKLENVLSDGKTVLDKGAAKNLGAFMLDSPAEIRMQVWSSLHSNSDNMLAVFPHVKTALLAAANVDTTKPAATEEAAKAKAGTRGGKKKAGTTKTGK